MTDFGPTKYEIARLLGHRATQLSNGAKPMTDLGQLTDVLEIAKKEYREGTIPIDIIRTMPNGDKQRVIIRKRK